MALEQTNTTQLAVIQTAKQDNSTIEDDSKAFEDPFWSYADLTDGQFRWNKVFPYRLCLWSKTDAGWDQDYGTLHPFTLPIAPENLSISTPFAITTSVTLGGIVEEHNGAPLRTITISGTTGVLPLRGQVAGTAITRSGPSLPSSIFAGTLSGVSALGNAVQQLGTGKGSTNVVVDDNNDDVTASTGYAQFKLLQRFLETYITYKKTSAARTTVLALEMWKDQEVYFVSPVSFELRRSAQTPLEYQYVLVFRAWKRVLPGMVGGGQIAGHDPAAKDLNKLAQVMNTLEAARGVLEAARKVLTGVRADINESLFNPIRECTTFVKDLLGVALNAADLPASIITDMKDPIVAAAGIPDKLNEFGGLGNRYKAAGDGLVNASRDLAQAFQNLSISSGMAQTGDGRQPDPETGRNQGGLEDGNPAHDAARKPDDNYEFFKSIKTGDLNLPLPTRKKIDDEKRRLRLLKREDFEERRDTVARTLAEFQESVGLGNETFSRIYSLPPKTQLREANEDDFDIIFAMNRVVMEMNRLVVSSDINQNEVTSIDYIAGLATGSGIAFTTPRSKFLVPLPYAHTLEQISLRYLGTPDRWHEIAALNGLAAPYIDETGFTLPLLTNGSGNAVTVSDATNLFVNQTVWLSSIAVGRIKRRITKIEALNPGLVMVTLDGDADLEQFTVGAGSVLQAFLPNTVNSQQSIFIPSDEEVDEEAYRLKSIPGVDYFDPLLRVGGIDLLLTPTGDLVITPDGDTRLAVGLTNIVQKVRVVIDTVRGSLLHHPEFGFPLQPGDSTAEMSAKDILKLCKGLFADDPTFTGVESAAILKDGPVCKITLAVGIAGTQQVIPITVEIPR